jgi:hypothetical protein
MTIGTLLLVVLGIIVVGLVAYWIITQFLPAETRKIALAIVGVLLLLVLLALFVPDMLGTRIW